jgi:hypothetical protein
MMARPARPQAAAVMCLLRIALGPDLSQRGPVTRTEVESDAGTSLLLRRTPKFRLRPDQVEVGPWIAAIEELDDLVGIGP